MRVFALFFCALLFAIAAFVAVNWEEFGSDGKTVASSRIQAPELAREIGASAYHLIQCGRQDEAEKVMAALDQMPETFREAVKEAFNAGMNDARKAKIDYTDKICAQFG